MNSDSHADYTEYIRNLIDNEGKQIADNARYLNRRRYAAFEELDTDEHEHLRAEARSIKEDAIDRLPELIDQLTEQVEANGGSVYLAQDAADANAYIQEVCDDVDADTVVKSKSMTSEEIQINDALSAAGIDPVETDLGELVIQVADDDPSHIVGPSLHKSRGDIAELFNEYFDPEEPLETAEELTQFARDYLAQRIEKAEVGMTGANFLAADTGTMCLITNEGNARKVVEATDTHIAVAGIEKIIPSFEDLAIFLQLVSRSGTGQPISSYTSLFSPPIDTPPVERDQREFHLVLIDNGRMKMRADDQLRETLYCVRCSACLNSCANFQSVGGHAFGGETYTGGIATGWEAGVHEQGSASEFNDLCTGCSRCVNQCPVKIDIPWINTVIRNRINREEDPNTFNYLVDGLLPDDAPTGISLQKRFFGNFETIAKIGATTAPLSNWTASTSVIRILMEKVLGVDMRRDLPTFATQTLQDWFQSRESPQTDTVTRQVVLYPDLYTNYINPDRGKSAVRVLEALGVTVRMPSVRSSGRAPLSQGMVKMACSHAQAVIETLNPYIEANCDIVVVEPSDLAMFRQEYGRLVDKESYKRISKNSYEIMEYIHQLSESGTDLDVLGQSDDTQVFYHSHCQQRTLNIEDYTKHILEQQGYRLKTSDVECCGMAGSFGYKNKYYDLSVDVGSDLQNQYTEYDIPVIASGTSCQDQIADLSDNRPPHPIELIDPKYN